MTEDKLPTFSPFKPVDKQFSTVPLDHIPMPTPPIPIYHEEPPLKTVNELLKLDIACGQNKKEGFIGVDIVKMPGVDVVHDLTVFPWPFKDDSVDEAFISHYIEHTPCLIKFMNELHRIMKKGAICNITAPYYNSMRAWQDPTHTRAISEASFLYYNLQWRKDNKLDHYPITADFDFQYGYNFYPEWAARNEELRAYAAKHFTNVIMDICVMLTKK